MALRGSCPKRKATPGRHWSCSPYPAEWSGQSSGSRGRSWGQWLQPGLAREADAPPAAPARSQNGRSGPRGPFRFPLRCEPRKMFTSRKCPSVHSPVPCPPPLTPEHLPGFDKRLRRTLGFESRGAASERRADVCLKVTCRSPCRRSAGRETATTPESPGTPKSPGTVSVRERTSLQPCRTPGSGWGLCLAVEKHPAPV